MDITLVFWMIVAGVVGYQLFTALGREDGADSEKAPERPRPRLVHSAELADGASDAGTPAWLATIKSGYPQFDTQEFLTGASSLYEMIVVGFAKGDLSGSAAFLEPHIKQAFQSVIDQRNASGQVSEVEFVGIENAEIVAAKNVANQLQVSVDFASNQIRVLNDAQGNLLEGTPKRIDLVKDRWTFARPVGNTDPNWTLVATGGQ